MTRRGGPDHKPQSSAWQGQVGPSPPFLEAAATLPPGCPPSACAPLTPAEDVFPCKDCGIWYRSERNLQAHLLYYCASRQSTGSPATTAADEKPKETYPNERVCPFPQCRKSCPSASSLEIHMRSHSGEAPCPLPRMPTGAHSSSA